jgi:hypothetical protein
MNVPFRDASRIASHGFVQLFGAPHPRRLTSDEAAINEPLRHRSSLLAADQYLQSVAAPPVAEPIARNFFVIVFCCFVRFDGDFVSLYTFQLV